MLKDALLLTLWTLGNQESFRGVGDRFGMMKGEAHEMFINTCKKLYHLKDQYILWPTGEKEETSWNFKHYEMDLEFQMLLDVWMVATSLFPAQGMITLIIIGKGSILFCYKAYAMP